VILFRLLSKLSKKRYQHIPTNSKTYPQTRNLQKTNGAFKQAQNNRVKDNGQHKKPAIRGEQKVIITFVELLPEADPANMQNKTRKKRVCTAEQKNQYKRRESGKTIACVDWTHCCPHPTFYGNFSG
jgi:hypothetical protein